MLMEVVRRPDLEVLVQHLHGIWPACSKTRSSQEEAAKAQPTEKVVWRTEERDKGAVPWRKEQQCGAAPTTGGTTHGTRESGALEPEVSTGPSGYLPD